MTEDTPDISVVMGVYNGSKDVSSTVESILGQQHVNLEFIVVDDGSTDETFSILEKIASKDERLRIIRQANQGLTRALIRGCAEARGAIIARQDCGDLSYPNRLVQQLDILLSNPDVVLVSCGARFVGPLREPMYEISSMMPDLTAGLRTLDIGKIYGPAHHGTTMFRRAQYSAVGGYRSDYYFAQDLDLWTRLAEIGQHLAVKDILYEARFALNSISGLQRKYQLSSTKYILECARCRRKGVSEASVLEKARAIRPHKVRSSSWARAASLYFVGACLRKRADPRAVSYFRDAIKACPVHVKSYVRLLFR